jgi:hypothetical protein
MQKFFDEIEDYRNDASIKTTLRILSIIESNRNKLKDKIDADVLESLIRSYHNLSNTLPSRYSSDEFKSEYRRLFDTLNYYLSRIVW